MNTIKQTNSDSIDMIFYMNLICKNFHNKQKTKTKNIKFKISHRMQLSGHTNHINIGCHSIKYITTRTNENK